MDTGTTIDIARLIENRKATRQLKGHWSERLAAQKLRAIQTLRWMVANRHRYYIDRDFDCEAAAIFVEDFDLDVPHVERLMDEAWPNSLKACKDAIESLIRDGRAATRYRVETWRLGSSTERVQHDTKLWGGAYFNVSWIAFPDFEAAASTWAEKVRYESIAHDSNVVLRMVDTIDDEEEVIYHTHLYI